MGTQSQAQLKWHQKPVAVILLLIFFFPLGLYFMWKNSMWSKKARWVITGILVLMIIANASNDKGGNGQSGNYVLNGVEYEIDITVEKNSDGAKAASEACQWINLWKMAQGGHHKDGSYIDGIGKMNGVQEDGDSHLNKLEEFLSKYSNANGTEKSSFLNEFSKAYKSCPNNPKGTPPPFVKEKFKKYGLNI